MLPESIKKFVSLSKQDDIKGSNPIIKELMKKLRKSGFSSHQISELSGWKWSSTLVRQYTKKWGGVDETLEKENITIMTTLRELALSNHNINDIETIRNRKYPHY